jgi:predicted small lipoprotein YifL
VTRLRAFGASARQARRHVRAFGASARQARRHVRAFGASARQARPRAAIIVAALLLPLAACGKKGPPLAPFRSLPGPVTEMTGRRVGQDVQIRFTVPTQNLSAGERLDLESVDIYAVTVAPGGIVPPAKELLTRKYLVTSIAVRPPPAEEEVAAEPEPGAPAREKPPVQKPVVKDERPLPGDRVTFVDTLTEAELRPAIVAKPPVVEKSAAPTVPPALDPAVVTRYYVVSGRSHRGDPGPQSPRLALPLVPAPEPPSAVRAEYTETALTLKWTLPPETIDPVDAAVDAQAWAAVRAFVPPVATAPPRTGRAATDPLAASLDPSVLVRLTRLPGLQLPPTVIPPEKPRFNVYAVTDGKPAETPLNTAPLTVASFAAGKPEWTAETCFAVRTVRVYGLVSIESPTTEPACVTPIDTFAPAAPAGLKAVAAAGAMNLIWDANSDPDLAGYLVLRGVAPGETLQALTPAPIAETNYTDTTVTPGVRYVYAIVAVDKAPKPNMSAQSARVEEVAR